MKQRPARPAPPIRELLGESGAAALVEALARYLIEEEERATQLAKRRGYHS